MVNLWIIYLVGGDWNMDFIFPYVGNVIIPLDSYFSEGLKPPTRFGIRLGSIIKNHYYQ